MRGLIIFAILLGVVAGYRSSNYLTQQHTFTLQPKDTLLNEESKDMQLSSSSSTSTSSSISSTSSTPAPALESSTITSNSEALPLTTTTASGTATSPRPTIETTIKEEPTFVELVTESTLSSSTAAFAESNDNDVDFNKRRLVTYDQRQEGQYNIRADLENFMIVLIPPSPAEGLTLLDLLTRSSLKRNTAVGAKSKRNKHHAASGSSSSSSSASPFVNNAKYRQAIKAATAGSSQNFNYLSRAPLVSDSIASIDSRSYNGMTHGHVRQQQPMSVIDNIHATQRLLPPEFIEGRTPYHVDISSNNDDQTRLHPDRQVDVLPPPPYPLAYQHLIKPYHLEAEPTVIQALPPAESVNPATHNSNNFLETYNQILASTLNENLDPNSNPTLVRNDPDAGAGGFYRISRAIRGDNFLDTNRLVATNNLQQLPVATTRHVNSAHLPLYRSELSFGASNLYPPIDVPNYADYITISANNNNARNLNTNPIDQDNQEQHLDEQHASDLLSPPNLLAHDDVELDSQDVTFLTSEVKKLLSDGMERCAPGHRRDSYGVCREIEGY